MWEIVRKDIDVEDPTSSLNRVYVGCTERETEADHEAVHAKKSIPQIRAAEVTNEKQNKTRTKQKTKQKHPLNRSQRGVTTCKNMPHGAWKEALDLLEKGASASKLPEAPFVDDHLSDLKI